MGWFDDSDDDDDDDNEDGRMRQRIGSPEKQSTSINTTKDDEKSESDEDPLDAYMKTLEKVANTTSVKKNETDHGGASCSGAGDTTTGRLDVENEDEATSHWIDTEGNNNTSVRNGKAASISSDSTSTNNAPDNTARGMASRALQRDFQKASDQQQQGDVDIKLQRVQHDQMKYAQIQKCLFSTSHQDPNKNESNDDDENNNEANNDITTTSRNTTEGHEWRKENQVTCQPPTLDPIYDFAELRDILPEEVLAWNVIKNLTKPTLVQSQTMGVALCGRDAIVTASTGSGKTLSYLWPIVAHLMANYHGVGSTETNSRSLVLVPTRELALQVEQIAKSMFAKLPLKALAITGGNMGRYQLSQKLQSTKPHCIIATPGRLLDVLSSQQKSKKEWLLPNISLLVLDEADKMIQMGFANQVTQILQSLRPDRQSLLVSATFDSRLRRRCQEWMHDPFRISVGKTGESSKHVIQHAICLPNAKAKMVFLKESLPTFASVGRTLVFCATRQGVETVATDLRMVLPVETLHGDRHLTDRKAALKAFAKGDVNVLVATDVAGRGLDIPQISTIINFDPAKNWDTHVHRIGRAGRLSAKEQQQQQGSAYTLLLPSNVGFARSMIQAYEREGRTIPPEVRKLVEKKNHQSSTRQQDGCGTFGGRWKNPSSGSSESGPQGYPHGGQSQAQQNDTDPSNFYGPATKRSRFS
jgi:ATP-dependent RNA helicase DDX42